MKILVASLLRALSMMGNVMVLAFFTFLLFGLMGMQLFAGKLRDESGSNPNYGITGFDNIFMSWLTILQCVSLEGWVDGTYTLTLHPLSSVLTLSFTFQYDKNFPFSLCSHSVAYAVSDTTNQFSILFFGTKSL